MTTDRQSPTRVAVVVASVDPRSNALTRLARFADEVRGRGEVILVVATGDSSGAKSPARDLPGVRVLERPAGALAPELWRDGLRATDAPLVAFTTAAMAPDPGWLDAMLATLSETGAAAVGGPIEPAESLSPVDRAVYLLRYANYLSPLPGSRVFEPPGDNAIYRRECLRGLESTIAPGFWEAEVHRELLARGETLAMAPGASVTFHGGCGLVATVSQRFRHARRYGAGRAKGLGLPARLARAAASPLVPGVLLARAGTTLKIRGRPIGPWLPALPGLAALLATWAAGEAVGTLSKCGPTPVAGGPVGRKRAGESTSMIGDGRPVGFLVVGAGFLGGQRAAAVSAAKGTKLVAVHDRDAARAAQVARRFGAAPVDDFEAALATRGVDAVVIATPHADHFAQALAALEAGKHVLCEKPLAVRPEEARLLALRADELRLRLATGLNHRFYPPVADALALASSGSIGRVEGVRAEIGHKADAAFLASWHTDPALSGGGTLMDNGPHACDLIRRLLGEVVAAKGYRRQSLTLARDCEPEAFALFKDFDRGFGELHSSWTLPAGYLTLEIRGSDGWLRVETAPWRLAGQLANGRRERRGYLAERVAERLFRLRFGCERSLVREVEAFVSSPGDERPEATGWDGCRVTEMIDAVYRSDETGAEVCLDPPLVNLPSSARRRAIGERLV